MTRARLAPEFDAVILAGGSAARMGGADKPGLIVGGTPLLVSVAQAAAAAGAARLIIVGPPRPGDVTASLSALAAGRPGWLAWVRESRLVVAPSRACGVVWPRSAPPGWQCSPRTCRSSLART